MTERKSSPLFTEQRAPRLSQWQALDYFCLYRLMLGILLLALLWSGLFPRQVELRNQTLYGWMLHCYLGTAILMLCLTRLHRYRFGLQVFVHALVDIVCLGLMIYAHVGPQSGLTMLFIVAVAGSSILSTWEVAAFVAALASMMILGGELYRVLVARGDMPDYTYAGFLGVALFAFSALGQLLVARTRDSEALASQQARALEDLSQLNEHIVHRMLFGVLVLDEQGVIHQCNPAAQEMLQVPAARGRDLAEVSVPIHRRLVEWRMHGEGQDSVVHIAESGRDVRLNFIAPRISPGYAVLVFMEDIATFKKHVQQVKLASLGRLTASIAHEVRNPLGAISNAGQLLLESRSLSGRDRQMGEMVLENARRVNRIIENILSVSQRGAEAAEKIDLVTWLPGFVQELRQDKNLSSEDIAIETGPRSLPVKVDPTQLQQVLWNLADNALRYSTCSPRLRLRCGVWADTVRPWLDVQDQGCGLPETVVENLFEPFVTTEQRGTGLGLYIARELCEANLANLVLHANGTDGCCFRINFSPVGDEQLQA